MVEHDKDSQVPVSRREFLALATGGVALAMSGWPNNESMGEASTAMSVGEIPSLDTGGIAKEHFENARERATAIVSRMTLAEKISQFGALVPSVPRIGVPAFVYFSSEALYGLIHGGPITSFPLPLAMGCSWNRSLMLRVFTAVSDEIWAWHKKNGFGLAVFSPPTVDLGARDPRWGRISENYSEDPYLIGQMAIYTIQGMQGNDPRYLKTIACAKHYIANGTDTDRSYTSATVDPRSFWEYYTRGFEASVRDGHVFTVMCSLNAMNGIPTSANRFLLTDLLRKRWGFRGYVVSDCGSLSDIVLKHHFVPTYAEAAALAVNAGCDINCGDTFQKYLGEAVNGMLVGESVLDRSLVRSLTGRILLGEFDPPEQNPYSKIPVSCLDSPAHRELAREAARQSIVLFKNENNALPLEKNRLKSIAVIGPMAATCYVGNYGGTPWFRVSPLQGIKDYLKIPTGPSYQKRASDFVGTSIGPLNGTRLRWCSEGGDAISNLADGSWASYDKILFTGATEFHARVASGARGGTIEVHLDSLSGPLLSKLEVFNTGGWQEWATVSAPLKPLEGEHTIYLRFTGALGNVPMFYLQSFELAPKSPVPAPAPGPIEVAYAMGCTVAGEKDPAQFAEAVKAAKKADVALVYVGAHDQVDAEGLDRSYIHLPGAQHELVQAVHAANPRTILVISSNCPVAVNWEQDHLPAIVGGLFLGEQQGNALVDVLFGDYNPGGKVSTTWYRRIEDLPDFHDYNIRNGRTYMYFQGDPLYAFGHGLSYTSFTYKNLQLSSKTLEPGGKITIAVEVTNSGGRAGDEIVQAYIHVNAGTVIRPIKQLVGFDRVYLQAGETRAVSFDLAYDDQALRYWDEDRYEFVVEPGTVDVMIGASSADIKLKAQIQLIG